MNAVLQKTMQSLEAALRYNPNSLELMSSLAEVYIRLGRFDRRTMELCEAVLERESDNLLLQQAQSIALLLEQSAQLDDELEKGHPPPSTDALNASLDILEEFLGQTPECDDAWVALVRFSLLAGRLSDALNGIQSLKRLGVGDLGRRFQQSVDYLLRTGRWCDEERPALAQLLIMLSSFDSACERLETEFEQGQKHLGGLLLDLYLTRYKPDAAHEVPEALRERLLLLLLDFGEREVASAWLDRATQQGWELTLFTKDYAGKLMSYEYYDDAFAVLQRLPLDVDVREMLDQLSELYETHDNVDQAVAVLRFLNDNALLSSDDRWSEEAELTREAELSMGEMQIRNGRPIEALKKFVAAFVLAPYPDPTLLVRIEELLGEVVLTSSTPLTRMAQYYREHRDMMRATKFVELAREVDPEDPQALAEHERLLEEMVTQSPEAGHLRLSLAQIYLESARSDRALAELEQISDPSLEYDKGLLLARALTVHGRLDEALARYRNIGTLHEHDCEALYELYTRFSGQGEMHQALMALDLIMRINPTYMDVSERSRELQDQLGSSRPVAEADWDPKMTELIGDLAVGRYQYRDRLGSGGMGVVYKVWDVRNQQVRAMKILRDTLSSSSKALDRFFREARIAATISHPNIVGICDYNISNISGQSYIVMEFVDGESMREVIDRHCEGSEPTSLDYVSETLFYAVQLCDALDAAHQKGIVHRDIKPDNIMLTKEGQVKVTDFGIVHVEEATFTPTGAMLGTPRYMSPEQVTGGKIDGRSDVYSVGIVLYEALTGAPPFVTGDISYQQVHNMPAPPREINPVIPQSVADVLMRCLAKDPDARHAKAHLLRVELAKALDDLGGCQKYGNANATEMVGDEGASNLMDPDLDL